MSKTILCTTDLNGSSGQTVQWAVKMAQQLGFHLTILYTYRLVESKKGEVLQMKKRMEEEARLRFKEIEKLYLQNQNIDYDFKVEIGFVEDRIEEHARRNNLSVLVINKNMISYHSESMNELIENIQVPTLVIP
jgi:hypothetical protein